MLSVKFSITGAALALLAMANVPDSQAAIATAVVSGSNHHCALTTAGGVQCWGSNSYGKLGNTTTINSNVPVGVSGLGSGVTQIAGGTHHNCALLADSSVRCWGFNSFGQLGNGTRENSSVPVVVTGLSGAIAIAAGGSHSCALMATGGVKCWGRNLSGELGIGTTTNSNTPVSALSITGATGIALGNAHSCAVINNGQVHCWGDGGLGQLGHDSTANSTSRVPVFDISDATSIVAGHSHSCAKTNTGATKCWGQNLYGQFGNGTNTNALTAIVVNGLSGVTQLTSSSASYSTCAIFSGGSAKCWGRNEKGQLGNGNTTHSTTPTTVIGLAGSASSITIGSESACARVNGGVQCWGDNYVGQHGAGNNNITLSPQSVVGLFGTAPSQNPEPISPITLIAPKYTWKAIPDATSYRLRINGVTTAYTAAAVNCPAGVGLCTLQGGALTSGSYSWQVQGFNEYGNGAWSALIPFKI